MDQKDDNSPLTATIALGADHAGYQMKEDLINLLKNDGYGVENFGTDSGESVDYPDFARSVADRVSSGAVKFGILICGTGIGMSMAANHHPAIRAALCFTEDQAQITREHNDANVLCLGAHQISSEQAKLIVKKFLSTAFSGAARHERRIAKLSL
ncbi:ribose 5-phosphate isomerase B [Candidatus Neomarinimicrobiota bacterium]